MKLKNKRVDLSAESLISLSKSLGRNSIFWRLLRTKMKWPLLRRMPSLLCCICKCILAMFIKCCSSLLWSLISRRGLLRRFIKLRIGLIRLDVITYKFSFLRKYLNKIFRDINIRSIMKIFLMKMLFLIFLEKIVKWLVFICLEEFLKVIKIILILLFQLFASWLIH